MFTLLAVTRLAGPAPQLAVPRALFASRPSIYRVKPKPISEIPIRGSDGQVIWKPRHTVIRNNNQMSLLNRHRNYDAALKVFEQSRRDGLPVDPFSFAYAIHALVNSKRLDEAQQIATQMHAQGAATLEICAAAEMRLALALGDVDRVQRVFETWFSKNGATIVLAVEAMRCYGRAGRLDQARNVLNRLISAGTVDEGAYTVACRAFIYQKKWDEYEQLVAEMNERFPYRSQHALVSLASALVSAGNTDAGLKLWRTACRRIEGQDRWFTPFVAERWVHILGQAGQLDECEKLWRDIAAHGIAYRKTMWATLANVYLERKPDALLPLLQTHLRPGAARQPAYSVVRCCLQAAIAAQDLSQAQETLRLVADAGLYVADAERAAVQQTFPSIDISHLPSAPAETQK